MYEQDWSRVEGSVRAIFFFEHRRYDSLAEAVKAYYPRYPYAPALPRYFVDAQNIVIPGWKIEETVQGLQLGAPSEWQRRYWRDRRYVYRQGPVPLLRGGLRRYRSCYRDMRTQAEIRDNDFLLYDEDAIEYGIKVRGARSRAALPTAWDDRTFRRERGWKRHRRRQYRE